MKNSVIKPDATQLIAADRIFARNSERFRAEGHLVFPNSQNRSGVDMKVFFKKDRCGSVYGQFMTEDATHRSYRIKFPRKG